MTAPALAGVTLPFTVAFLEAGPVAVEAAMPTLTLVVRSALVDAAFFRSPRYVAV